MIYYTYLRKPNPRCEELEQENPQCREDDRIVNNELFGSQNSLASVFTVKSNKQRFTVSIEAGYIEALRQRAANEGTSTGDLIRRAIATYIEAVGL